MKAVFIGAESEISDMVGLSIRLRWPSDTPVLASTGAQGLEMVEQITPDVVIFHPSVPDMTLSEAIQGLRRFSNIPWVCSFYYNIARPR